MFTQAPKQKSQVFIITTPGRRKLPISPKQSVLKIYFPQQREGGL